LNSMADFGTGPARERLEALADTLWAERHLVEFLLYKLTVAKLLLVADERRFVSAALAEVEQVVGRLRDTEEGRHAAVDAVAADWRRPAAQLTLSVLAAEAPEPMRAVFEDHRKGFLDLSAEIEETAAENRRLASGSLNSIQQALEALTGAASGPTYNATGRTEAPRVRPSQWDQVL
jgi:hypothetical protein